MDLLLSTRREYSTRTGAHFTVRSANSVSYSRRPLVHSRYKEGGHGKQSENEIIPYHSRTCSGVKGQSLEREKMTIKQAQNSTRVTAIEFVAEQMRDSKRQGRTEWRRSTPSTRSKSLDWRTDAKSPERSYRTGAWTSKTEDIRGADRDGSRIMSTIQVYSTANTNSDEGTTLSRGGRGQSLPSMLRSQSVSLGPKASQSILERIEKLYGVSEVGNTDDYNTKTEPSYRKGSIGATFRRRFSSGEHRVNSDQSGESLTWTTFKDSSVSNTTLAINRAGPALGQWHKETNNMHVDEGSVFQSRGLPDMGTQSLDRARSRCTIAAQIRAARAAKETAKPSEAMSEVCTVKGQAQEKGQLWMKTNSLSDKVFESNSQKIHPKSTEKKPSPSAASVRNKINQFEALSQRAQTSSPRRSFSVPAHLSEAYEGVQKSSSDKAVGTVKNRWDGLKDKKVEVGGVTEINTCGSKTDVELQQDKTVKKELNLRTVSVDETRLYKVRRSTEKELQNKHSDEFNKYSKLRTTLDLPLKKYPKPIFSKNFNIDETDFFKMASPVEVGDTSASPLIPDYGTKSSASASEIKSSHSRSSTPVSDDDKTPTNTPENSPFLSPSSPQQKTSIFDHKESEPGNYAPKEETKTPTNDKVDILPSLTSSNLPDLVNPDNMNGQKRVLNLNAWLDGLNTQIQVSDYDDDDDSTQKDEDSNYDSDSGESSVTITSNMSSKCFSVNLADLCNFAGVDYEFENDSDEWPSSSRRSVSLSSDVSVFSCVSVLPTEELDKLIEDVRSIGDDNLQDYEDVHVVVLHKEIGVGLGFSLAGGMDQNKPVTVHKVFHSGVAAQEGSIREGDHVLSINGTALSGYAHWEALRVLRRAKSSEMGVVVLKKPDVPGLSNGNVFTVNQGRISTQVTETGQHISVCLEKNNRDLGFSLEGGVGSSLGNKSLTVQKIFQGGPVDKVVPGDEVLEINSVSVVGMRRLEAWTLIRKLPPGPVNVVLRRHPQPHKT